MCESVDRVPWVPFVGCHSGALLDVSAREYLASDQLIVEGVSKAIELYQPDGVPIAFDLQIEAEALGCELSWGDENPSAVIKHPLCNGTKLEDLTIPTLKQGRIRSDIGRTLKR